MVTVGLRGTVKFNPAAAKALGEPDAIVFLVDKEDRLLGFRAGEVTTDGPGRRKGTGNAQPLRTPGNTVSATHVLRYLHVDLSQSRRYPLVAIDGVQCIELKRPGMVVTSNRRKPRPDHAAAGGHVTTIGTGSGQPQI
jgi:hypothetical protein